MNRPPVTTKAANAPDSACSDPLCSYRAEIEGGYWLDPSQVLLLDDDTAVERLARALFDMEGQRDSDNKPVLWADIVEDWKDDYRAAARNLIAALREGGQR